MLQRAQLASERLSLLLHDMAHDPIAPVDKIHELRAGLAEHFRRDDYLRCESMGALIRQNLEAMKGRKVGPWLSLDVEGMKGKFLRLPDREDLALPVNEQLVIEFYSR